MTFKPAGDRLLVLEPESTETTESGLHVPESAQKPYIWGTIELVGPGRRNEAGDRVVMDYGVGDKIMFHRHAGGPIEVGDVTYKVLAPADVVGIDVEDEPVAKRKAVK